MAQKAHVFSYRWKFVKLLFTVNSLRHDTIILHCIFLCIDNAAAAAVPEACQDDLSRPGFEEKHLSEEKQKIKDTKTADPSSSDNETGKAVKVEAETKTQNTDAITGLSVPGKCENLARGETGITGEVDDQNKTHNTDKTAAEVRPSSLSPDAPEFVPRSLGEKNPERPPLLRRQSSSSETCLVNTVKDVLHYLTESPGEFVEQCAVLVKTWNSWPCDDKILQEIVNLIFEQVW